MGKKRKGIGSDTGTIKISDGLIIDSRVKVGSVLWLQEKYDCDFSEVMKIFAKGKVNDTINLIIALAIQHDCDKTESDIRKYINQLEINELTDAASKLTGAFETDAKNLKRPVSGNIQE